MTVVSDFWFVIFFSVSSVLRFFFFFFFNDTATTEIYTLSLHDALPIWRPTMATVRYRDLRGAACLAVLALAACAQQGQDRKSTRLNSSHLVISYAVFCLKKKKKTNAKQHGHRSSTETATARASHSSALY